MPTPTRPTGVSGWLPIQTNYPFPGQSVQRYILPDFDVSGTIFPWNYDFMSGAIPPVSGNYFGWTSNIPQNFVEAVTERVMALNWYDPTSGIDIHKIARYFLPQSGEMPLWTSNDNPDKIGSVFTPNFDHGLNWSMLQRAVYNMAAYYASSSGSYDNLLYPIGFPSGGFPNYMYGNVPSGSENEFSQDYWYYQERFNVFQPNGILYRNPPSGNTVWPPPSGFTRVYPREVYECAQSGSLGQVARFVTLIQHTFNNNIYPSGLRGGGFVPFPGYYNTPSDQQKLSSNLMKYTASGWVSWDEDQFGPKPKGPDLVLDFGLITYGDYIGPWILNDLQTAINRLQRICAIKVPQPIGFGSYLKFNHNLYPMSVWRSNTKNDKSITIPFDVSYYDGSTISIAPHDKYWQTWVDNTNLTNAWAGSSGVSYTYRDLVYNFVGGTSYYPSSSSQSGIINDVFYTRNYTIAPSGTHSDPPGYLGYYDGGGDFYDSHIDHLIDFSFNPPSGIPATGIFYWRGYDQLSIEESPDATVNQLSYGYDQYQRPFGGMGEILNDSLPSSNTIFVPGVSIKVRQNFLTSSGFLPGRNALVNCYAYSEIIDQAASGNKKDPSSSNYSTFGKFNPLGTSLKWHQWTNIGSGIVTSGQIFRSSSIGDCSTLPNINILDNIPSGNLGVVLNLNNVNQNNFYYDHEGYEVTDHALIVDYAISGGFKYQGPIKDISYPDPSGLLTLMGG